MKKTILALLLFGAASLAGTKIFLDYEYNMPLSKTEGLEKVAKQSIFPKKMKVYKDENNQFFAFLDNKLKSVFVMYTDYNIKEEIEKILKNGFRLKKIVLKGKYGNVPVKNVGELLKKIDEERNRGVFNSMFDAILVFENIDGVRIVMDIKEVYERKMKNCVACDYIDHGETKSAKLMTIFFTKKAKK